jgi:hypothetical protein
MVAVDAVEDDTIISLDRLMHKREVFVPILAQMCLTMVRSLQQIKCAPHGKSLCNMLAPTMDKTLTTNCRKRLLLISSSLCTPMMSS